MTLLVSDGKAEEGQHKIEVELKSIAGGKSSKATLTYSQPAMMKKIDQLVITLPRLSSRLGAARPRDSE